MSGPDYSVARPPPAGTTWHSRLGYVSRPAKTLLNLLLAIAGPFMTGRGRPSYRCSLKYASS